MEQILRRHRDTREVEIPTFNFQMGDLEKMAEEERDQKIIEFFRAVFQTYDPEKSGQLFHKLK